MLCSVQGPDENTNSQLWANSSPEQEVNALLSQVFEKIGAYYERLQDVKPEQRLIGRRADQAWKLIGKSSGTDIKKDLYGCAAYHVTLQYPKPAETRALTAAGLCAPSYHSLFSVLPRFLGIDESSMKRAMVWQVQLFDQLVADLASCNTEKREKILIKVVEARLVPLIYMIQAVPREEVREKFFAYQKLGFYYGLSYVLDDVIDDPCVSDEEKRQLDIAVEKVLLDREAHLDSDSKVVQVAFKYLKKFSEEIRGSRTERQLRVHLLAFHQVQRAAQGNLTLSGVTSNVNYLTTAKAAFAFASVPLLFERPPAPDYWERLIPVATLSQFNDDIKDYTDDLQNGQLSAFTHYAKVQENEDPLALWPKVISDLIHGQSTDMQRSMLAITIHNLARQSLEQLEEDWPAQISPATAQLLDLVKEKPARCCLNNRVVRKRPDGIGTRIKAALQDLQHDYVQHRQEVSDALRSLCARADTQLHRDMARVLEGGKCGRSYLVRLVAERFGWDPKRLQPFMLAVEMAQTASLVFDDLPSQDDAKLRRGKACLHTDRPVYEAELTAISLITEPFRVMCSWDIDPQRRLKIMELAAQDMGPTGLCLGQLIDLDESPQNFEDFIEMYALKTSKGFRIPLVGAAIACGASPGELKLFEKLADRLGVAYQIRDDLLEEEADDKSADRVARRILDVDPERAKELFYACRRDVLETVFTLFSGEVQVRFLRVALKLLMLPGESDPYEEH